MKLITTILCGGSGSRLWPISRENHPKPFMKLADGESLLQKTFIRAANLPNVTEMLTVGKRELLFKTHDEYNEINTSKLNTSFILEPVGRDTAPAVAMTCLYTEEKHGGDAVVLILAADHLISDQKAFEQSVEKAIALAQQGKIVTFGIKPTAPETGFGYIQHNGEDVIRFVEKPSLDLAEEYIAAGNYLWNSGMFCFKVDTMLKEMETHCPLLLDLARKCWKLTSSLSGPGSFQAELNKNSFNKLPSISIDFAVMEKSKSIAVVSCDIGWSDIGSWNAVSDLTTQDSRGNSIKANTVVLHDVDNCHIQSDSRLIGAVGVKDLIIIDTRDALLVANKNSSQNVKQIFAKLKSDNHETHRTHVSENRPWGIYTTLEEGEGFKIKRIEVKPGGALSLQSHEHRSEHWIVVTGEATVHNDGKELTIKVNESTYIQAGHKHRLSNKTKENLVLIEVQVGSYLGEDDIKRYEDVYGRV